MKDIPRDIIPLYDSPDSDGKYKTEIESFDGEEFNVIFRKGNPGITIEQVHEMRARGEDVDAKSILPPFRPRTYRATEVAPHITCMQEQAVIMRDGVTIYADIYLPENEPGPFPLIISWGPYGKRPREGQDTWKAMGVPPGTFSNMAKFESSDPAFWCRNGYAVANVDPRGVGHSEGDVHLWGPQDGQDGYDFIEWAAQQGWCNGRCALYGNSGVAMVQWRIAAENPPHLACFAAWEGTGDIYRESICLGGIPSIYYEYWITRSIAASNYVEDNASMLAANPFMNKFWESKIPNWRNIKAPAYICCGMCHPCHLRGSLEGFRRIRSPKKWIRIHREHEWPDSVIPENMDDLKRFYDRYLKDIRNGWEMTPKVRLDVMDAYEYDFKRQRPENEFPLARTKYTKLYLNAADCSLNENPVEQESELVYDAKEDTAAFVLKFKEETEISGYMKMHLFLEARDYDNMDIMTWVTKYKEDGTYVPLRLMGIEHRGTYSFYRASHRELDPRWTTDFQPVQAHFKAEPMIPGEVYECEIEILASSRIWHKGEELHLEITGHHVPCGQPNPPQPLVWDNEGRHVIHTGGKYDSYLQIPIVPPKYTSGEFKYWD